MLSKIERRNNLPLADLDRMMDFQIFGLPSTAGVQVNAHAVRAFPALFCAERILSETLAAVPLNVIQRTSKGKQIASNHPLQAVLHGRPNPWQTSFEFRRMLQGHVVLRGNGYAEIFFDMKTGYPQYLIPRHPDKMIVVRLSDTKLGYGHIEFDGSIRPISAGNMLHIRNLSSDGIKGDSMVTLFRNTFGGALAREEHGARLFKNGAQVPYAIKTPKGISDKALKNLRESLTEEHTGVMNAHRPMLLEDGMEALKLGITSEESQFILSRKFDIADISRMTNVPPHMLKELDPGTKNNIEQMGIEFKTYTMLPHYVNWEQQMDRTLLSDDDSAEFFTKFNIGGLERGDMKSRYDAYAVGRQWGWLSANAILDLEDMNPIEGGDQYMVPLNMAPAGTQTPGNEPNQQQNSHQHNHERRGRRREQRLSRALTLRRRIQRNYLKIFKEAAGRQIRRETAELRKGLEKHLGQRSGSSLDAFVDEFYQSHQAVIARSLLPALHSYAAAIQSAAADEVMNDTDMSVQLEHFASQYASSYAAREAGSRRGQLKQIIRDSKADDLSDALSDRLDDWEDKVPDKTGLRESIQAGAAIARLTWKLAGVGSVAWVANDKACPLCQEMDGETSSINDNFLEDGDTVDPDDGDTTPLEVSGNIAHPQLHEGCECMLAPA